MDPRECSGTSSKDGGGNDDENYDDVDDVDDDGNGDGNDGVDDDEDEDEVFVDQARNERREALSMILKVRRSEREVSSMSVESKINPGVN